MRKNIKNFNSQFSLHSILNVCLVNDKVCHQIVGDSYLPELSHMTEFPNTRHPPPNTR